MKPDIDIATVRLLLSWCVDAQSREIINSPHYTYDSFSYCLSMRLDTVRRLVEHVNPILKLTGCKLRIGYRIDGTIVPLRSRYYIRKIDNKLTHPQ